MGPSAAGDPLPPQGFPALPDSPEASHPTFVFAMGQVAGELRAINANLDRHRNETASDIAGLGGRVRVLEIKDGKRDGQTSIIAVVVAAGVSIVVGVATGLLKG